MSGEEGLTLARQIRPRVAVVDVRMPGGMDGYEACRRIKDLGQGVKVLVISAGADELSESKAALAGADQFCLKNFDYHFLHHIIKEMLDDDEPGGD